MGVLTDRTVKFIKRINILIIISRIVDYY